MGGVTLPDTESRRGDGKASCALHVSYLSWQHFRLLGHMGCCGGGRAEDSWESLRLGGTVKCSHSRETLHELGTKWAPLSLPSPKAPTACYQGASRLRKSKIHPLLGVVLEAQGTSILVITRSGFSPQIPRARPFSCFLSATLARKFSLTSLANWPLTLPLSIPTAPALIHTIVICLLPLQLVLK